MMKGRCLVTGGAGFIGSHLVEFLIAEGHRVTVIDNLSTGKSNNVAPDADLIELDLGQPQDLTALVRNTKIVFHLAALSNMPQSFMTPIEHDNSNVRSTLFLLKAMAEVNSSNLVVASSAAVYGNPVRFPTPESEPGYPLSPYALQKYVSEQYALMIGRQEGIKVTALRYFNVYGPQSNNSGSPAKFGTSVITIFHQRRKREQIIEVTGDGEQKRDFVHVQDVVEANYLSANSDRSSGVYNVATGKAISIKKLASMMSESWVHVPEQIGEPRISHGDIGKIRRDLNWRPRITLRQALERNLL